MAHCFMAFFTHGNEIALENSIVIPIGLAECQLRVLAKIVNMMHMACRFVPAFRLTNLALTFILRKNFSAESAPLRRNIEGMQVALYYKLFDLIQIHFQHDFLFCQDKLIES